MNEERKISPAFEAFLADSRVNDKRDAIVIYQAPEVEGLRLRGRLRVLKERLDEVKEVQKTAANKFIKGYQETSREITDEPLKATTIGTASLPVANVEITRQTLEALAEQPEVVAVLPNQKIELIKPFKVDYDELGNQENQDGLTWGLKHLEVPKIWETTKGRDINVAVLDTGVYADNPALKGRVKDFVVD